MIITFSFVCWISDTFPYLNKYLDNGAQTNGYHVCMHFIIGSLVLYFYLAFFISLPIYAICMIWYLTLQFRFRIFICFPTARNHFILNLLPPVMYLSFSPTTLYTLIKCTSAICINAIEEVEKNGNCFCLTLIRIAKIISNCACIKWIWLELEL